MCKFIVLVVLSVIIASNGADAKDVDNKSLLTIQKFKPFQNETTTKNCGKNCDENSRKPKSFTGLSFLTGLGIGSLAGAAAANDPISKLLANQQNLYANLHSKFPTTTKSPLAELNINFSSEKIDKFNNLEQLSRLETSDLSRINTATYPYALALSTNSLVNETLRSVQQVLEQLRDRLDQRDALSAEQSNARPQYDDLDDEDNVVEGFNQRVSLNCSTLTDIIRSTIAEEIAKNHLSLLARQSNVTAPNMNQSNQTEQSTTTTTTAAPHQGYYYGGNPQNVSGVDLTSYGPPAYGPPVVRPIYPIYPPLLDHHHPPSYGPTNFHQDSYPYDSYHGQTTFHQDHHPYESYHNHFTGIDGPYYDPHARALPKRASKDLKVSTTGGFSPSKIDKNP